MTFAQWLGRFNAACVHLERTAGKWWLLVTVYRKTPRGFASRSIGLGGASAFQERLTALAAKLERDLPTQ